MNFPQNLLSISRPNNGRDIFARWTWALPILLLVAWFGLREIDLFSPSPDEFYSLYHAGWLVGGPRSPLDVVESLHKFSPNHAPGYFILLSVWGNLTSYDIASARILGVFCGLLSLAVYFRLARDVAGPMIALFALIIISSNAYYNFFYPHARMYSLLTLLAGLVFWLYWRIISQPQPSRRRDYFALAAAVSLFMYTHAFSVVFLLVLAVYHLLFVARDQRWHRLAFSAAAGALLAAPSYLIIATRGVALSQNDWDEAAASAWQNIGAWLELASNGQALLVAIAFVGLLLMARQKRPWLDVVAKLFFIFLVLFALLSDITEFLVRPNMRYLLPANLFFALLMAAGIYAFYCYRRIFGILLLALWCLAGILFQMRADWWPFLAGRVLPYNYPPWQVLSRLAWDVEPRPSIVGYRISGDLLEWQSRMNYSQWRHYFDEADIGTYFSPDLHDFGLTIRQIAIASPSIWVLYQRSVIAPGEVKAVESTMANFNYDFCGTQEIGIETVILQFAWHELACARPESKLNARTAFHEHQFYGARVSADRATLTFADRWAATSEFPYPDYMMSFQLISADWQNVAQVDLPLVHEGRPRRFAIDISAVAPGAYRLMAIFYNVKTGDRADWLVNEQDIDEMLALEEIALQ